MANVLLPGGEQRSGKIGSWVYSHGRNGPYVRAIGSPVNPNTSRQIAVRNTMQALAIAWGSDLTEAQRDQWDTYGLNVNMSTGYGFRYLPGVNHYVRSNASRLQAGLSRVDDGPTVFSLAAAEGDLSATGSEATQTIEVSFGATAAWCSTDGAYQAVYMGLPQRPSRSYFGGPWRFIGVILGDAASPPTSPATFDAAWPIAQGQRIWIRTRIGYDDGRLSMFAQTDFHASA